MTKEEEILNNHVSLYFSSHHDKSRWNGEGENGGAEWHTDKAIAADIYKAMDEFAKQQAVAFAKWTAENLWTVFDDNWYPYQDEDNPVSAAHLYSQFIEQQTEQ